MQILRNIPVAIPTNKSVNKMTKMVEINTKNCSFPSLKILKNSIGLIKRIPTATSNADNAAVGMIPLK